MQAVTSLVSRIFFAGAFVLLVVAVLERIARGLGYTIIGQYYGAGRLLDFAVVLLIFVIALLLRDIREAAKS